MAKALDNCSRLTANSQPNFKLLHKSYAIVFNDSDSGK